MQVELIKTLQAEKGFSNKKIAEATRLSESTISRILSRQVEPKFEDVVRIAVVLGASLDALAGIARIEIAEEKSLSSALKEKDAQIEVMKEDHRKATTFLMEQIAVRDRALAQKDKTIDGLMQALLNK